MLVLKWNKKKERKIKIDQNVFSIIQQSICVSIAESRRRNINIVVLSGIRAPLQIVAKLPTSGRQRTLGNGNLLDC